MRTPTAAPQPFVRFIILILALGLLAGTGYAWRALTRSVRAYADERSPRKSSIEARTSADSPADSAVYASAALPPGPGQARFHPHVNLSNTGGQTSNLSDVAFAGNKVFVAWHEMGTASEVRFRASVNGGASFGNSPAGQVLATIPGGETLFSIAVAATSTHVHVIYSSGASEATAQVSYRFSINNGANFSSPVILAAGPGGSPFPDIATDGAGNVHVLLEDRGGLNDIQHRLSTDGGLNFGIAVNISNTADESIKPRIAANGANIGVVWQENGSGGSEVQFIHSTDGGLSWPGPSQNLSNSSGTDSSPADIAYGNSIQVVWAEGLSVAHRSSSDLGATFSPLANVATAAAGESIRGPRVAANGSIAGIVWMIADSSNVVHGPFLRRSEDGGATFAAVQNVANGLAGTGLDPAAIVAAPSLRIVWSHSLSGNATDAEVLFLREISCSVYWANPVSGNFATAANWSTGVVPTSASDVCIKVDGDYTVTSSAGRTINSLVVGDPDNTGSQTLQISGSTLTALNGALNSSSGTLKLENIAGTVASTLSVQNGVLNNIGTVDVNPGSGGLRNISADLVNDGTVNINANTTFNNGSGVYTNNNILNIAATRTLTITGSNFDRQVFNQNGGMLNIAGAFNLTSFTTFNFNGGEITGVPVLNTVTLNIGPGSTGAGEFFMRGFCSFSGDIAPAHTVNVNATTTAAATLSATNGFTNAGTINLETINSTGASNLQVNGSGVLTNVGTINVNQGTGGLRNITADLINDGTVNINANTTFNNGSGVYTNNNILNIAATRTLTITGSNFNRQIFNQNGTLNIAGAFNLTSFTTFNFNGGSITGVPVLNTATLNIGPGSTGAGEFFMRGFCSFSGDIAPAQTVNINSTGGILATLTAANGFTNAGTINLETIDGAAASNLQVNGSGVLTNVGTINVNQGTGGLRNITADLINDGTVNINANTTFNNGGGVYTNNNILNIAATKTLSITGSQFNPQTFRQNGGSITGGGNINLTTNVTFFGRGNVAANLNIISGNVHPGASPGILNITGNYTQDSNSDLFIELGGPAPGTGYDQLNISGTATLSGRLNVSVINGHCVDGNYEFMTFGSRTGNFTSISGLNPGNGRTITAIPGATNYVLNATGPVCNSGPVANDDSYTINEDTILSKSASAGVLANDTDTEGSVLTAILVTGPSHGSLTLHANGSIFYRPNDEFSGTDSFTYKANDGQLDSNVATVTITINSVNDPPKANNDSATVDEDSGANAIDVLANDTTAPDTGETLTITSVTQGGHGSVAITGGGTGLTYTPDANFSGPASFTYTVSDGNSTDTALVSVTVNPLNDPPNALDDVASVVEDSGANAIDVRANDTFAPDSGETLTVTAVTQGANGAVVITGGGTGLSYTPNANFNGSDSFTYTISDGNGGTDTATVNVNVNSINDPPDALDDAATVAEDSGANTINVAANDSFAPDTGETLTVSAVTQGTHGTVAIIGGGSGVSYTPTANFFGPDSFTYTINDGNGASDTATVNVTVTAVNDPPKANNDTATVDEDSGATAIDVLANDTTAPDTGETLTITAVSAGANTVVITGGGTGVTFTPNANFSGPTGFSYTISDGNSADTATVSVTVNPVNDAPNAQDNVASVVEDSGANAIDVLANDTFAPDSGEILTVTAVTQGANGAVVITGGGTGLSYTPNANFNGSDSFTYTISDGNGGTDTATVNVNVTSFNDPPDAVNDAVTVAEDSGANTINVAANDSSAPDSGETLTVVAVTQSVNGVVAINAGGASVSYTPNADFQGSDSFSYTIGDGNGGMDTATVTIAVTNINDAPDAVEDEVTTEEDAPVNIPVRANDTDVDNDTATVDSVTQGTNGAVVINPDGTVTYTPQGNFNGNDSFTYTVSDGHGGSDTATVNVTVTPVNDAPAAVNDQASTNEDIAIQIDVRANDTDVDNGDTLAVVTVAQGTNGTVVINPDGTISYTPNANFNGSDTFTYTIDDGHGGSSNATVSVTIAPVNDPPDAVNDAASVLEDSGANAITVLANDSFAPDTGETLTITAVTQGVSGAVAITGGGTGVSYTPNGNFNGNDTFDYTISDGHGGTDTATVTITANAANDPPVTVNDSYSTGEDNPLVVGAPGVLSNDGDVDGDALTVALVSGPGNGALTLNPNGSFTYAPAANFFGSDSFTYKAGDGALDSNTATVTITVNAVNDPPDALNDSATTNHNAEVAISVLANDTDVEGHTLTVTAVTQGANGSVIVNSDGTVTYKPNTGFSGADSFSYNISDGFGGTDTAIVNVTVNPSAASGLSKFVAFSRELTWLLNGTKVFTGDVGANNSFGHGTSHWDDDDDPDRKREVRIGEEVKMFQPSSRVVGDTIWLRQDSQVYNLHYNELINKHGTILGLQQHPLTLPVLTLPGLPQINPGTQDIEVKNNKTHTIAPGRYRNVRVQHGGTLILTGGIYHLSTLDVRTQAKLIFRGPSEVRIKNEMDTDARTYIGPDASIPGLEASDIVFYVAGGDDKGRRHEDDFEPGYREEEVSPTVVQIGVENTIKANIYAPDGTVWIKKGGKATGAFIGKRARIGVRVELTLDSAF